MLKRNWYFIFPLLLIGLPVLLTGWYSLNYGYDFANAWEAVRHFGSSGTRYTQNYSESNFDKIRPGVDARTVYQIMGMQPFERRNNDTEWYYSFAQGDAKYYHERVVIFERDKLDIPRVKAVVKKFHQPASK